MKINYGKAQFVLKGTGDNWSTPEVKGIKEEKEYTMTEFNKYFSENSLSILKEVFLSENIDIDERNIDEYEDIFYKNLNGFGSYPKYLMERKNLDGIYNTLTDIYKKIYESVSKEQKTVVLKKVIKLFTAITIGNCKFAKEKCDEFLPVIKYVDRFSVNDIIKEYVYFETYKNIDKLYEENIDNIDTSLRNLINPEITNEIKKQDIAYVAAANTNSLKPYINNDELTLEEQTKRFYKKYVVNNENIF